MSRAANFYRRHIGNLPPTARRIKAALEAIAPDMRPNSWRTLRSCIARDQADRGYSDVATQIRAITNPVTANWRSDPKGTRAKIKPPRKKVKRVKPADLKLLTAEVSRKGDVELLAAIGACWMTGARPAELSSIEDRGGGTFFIRGVKKRDDRGADRLIRLSESEAETLSALLPHLRKIDNPKALGNRLARITQRLWPQRKARPTLYSLRHTLGGDLKASGVSRREIAYIMGHRATASADPYGDPRSSARTPTIRSAGDTSNVIENHGTPRSGQRAAKKTGPKL